MGTVSSPVSAAVPPAAAASAARLGPHTVGDERRGRVPVPRDRLRAQAPALFGVFTQAGRAGQHL